MLAGDGEPAAWKAELLAAAGARLQVFAPHAGDRLAKVAADAGLRLEARAWTEADLEGALIALLETEDDDEAQRFAPPRARAGALVNVIDRPAFCDFSFGSIVERSPLVIGVSTDGAAPVFAQAVRSRVEAMVPETFALGPGGARLATALGRVSQSAAAQSGSISPTAPSPASTAPPTEADFEALSAASTRPGRLIVVGAGRGGADDLLTLRAVRALQAADHIIEDGADAAGPARLRPPGGDVRALARRRWRGGRAAAAERVAAGQTVVVLVPGDGRGTAWAAPKSRRGSLHEPVRLRPRLLRRAGHCARQLGGGGLRERAAPAAVAAWRDRGVDAHLFDDDAAARSPARNRRSSRSRPTPRAIPLCAVRARCAASFRRIVYLSTVGVYGDSGGEWVDETSPLKPSPRARTPASPPRPRGGRSARETASPSIFCGSAASTAPAAAHSTGCAREPRGGSSSPARCSTASTSTTSPRRRDGRRRRPARRGLQRGRRRPRAARGRDRLCGGPARPGAAARGALRLRRPHRHGGELL